MDNYWGGIVKWTKIPSQILKGDCQIKFHVPFIKKFIHPENHWMWVVGDYWGDWGFLGTLLCIWWREEEGGVPLLGRSPEDAGVDHWVSHQPRATPSFKAKVVSMFVDCRFLEEKSKIGYESDWKTLNWGREARRVWLSSDDTLLWSWARLDSDSAHWWWYYACPRIVLIAHGWRT